MTFLYYIKYKPCYVEYQLLYLDVREEKDKPETAVCARAEIETSF